MITQLTFCCREHLYRLLSDILDPDELNIMNILLKDVTLQVKNNITKGQTFTTTLGIPQGDCLSAILFALYLSNTLSAKIPNHLYDHNYYNAHNMFLTPFEHFHDHNYDVFVLFYAVIVVMKMFKGC